jgi:hypothetical protein
VEGLTYCEGCAYKALVLDVCSRAGPTHEGGRICQTDGEHLYDRCTTCGYVVTKSCLDKTRLDKVG